MAQSLQLLALFLCVACADSAADGAVRGGAWGGTEPSLPRFATPEGETPYIGACPYPSGCGPDCGVRWNEAKAHDCPQTCPTNYGLSCKDNCTAPDGRPPASICGATGAGYRLVGVGGARGVTCCRCDLSEMSSSPAPAQPQCPHFEVEAIDTDMAGALLAERAADTSDGCCPFCEEVDGCEGYAYLNQVCYLKGNFSGTFFQTGVVSRVKRALGAGCPGFQAAEQGKDLVGDLLDEWSAPNPEVCCAACAERGDCQGFAFFDGRCYLKANVRGTYSHDGCMIRVKEGVLSEVGSTPEQPQPQCPDFETQVADTDLTGALLGARRAASSDGCCPLCEELDGCEGFAYFEQVCYLKGTLSGTFQKAGVVSRIKRALGAGCPGFKAAEQGKDLVGDLLEAWSAANPELCCAACAGKTECQGFAFVDGRCYLKANVRGTYGHDGCMVRVKEGVMSEVGSTPEQPQPQCPDFETQVADTDMDGVLLAAKSAATSDGCCTFCEDEVGCEGFAYFEQVCYLKGNFSGTFSKVGVVSRMRKGVGTSCPGFAAKQNDKDLAGDLVDIWSAPQAEHCCAACAMRPDCQGFAFFEGYCFLKGNVQGTYDHSGCMVQMKEGVLSEGGGGRRLGGMPLLV